MDDDMEMSGFIEESLDESKDIFGGDTQEVVQYENVETKNPAQEQADREIEKKLDEIPSKFDDTARKEGGKTEVKASKQSPSKAPAPSAKPKAARPTTAKPQPKKAAKTPSQQDLANSQKAASRLRDASAAKKKADTAAAAKVPPKRKVDVKKLEKNIKDTKAKKDQELK